LCPWVDTRSLANVKRLTNGRSLGSTMARLDFAVSGKSLAEHCELARYAESQGFGGSWVSEVSGLDAVTQASAVGASIETGRIGTAIVPIQTRDPLLMAMTAHTLAGYLDGRFVLGLGTSTRVIIEDWHSRPWGLPVSGMREYIELVRRFLAGERVTFEGRGLHYSRAALASPRPRQVPIYLAALNERMLRLAGEAADGVILNFSSVGYVNWAIGILRDARAAAGRNGPFEISLFLRATVTPDPASVLRRYQQEFLTYLLSPVYQVMFSREGQGALCSATAEMWASGDRANALNSIPLEFIRERALVGTRSEIHARMDDYFAAGVDTILLMPVPNPEHDHHQACLEMLDALSPATTRVAGPAKP
jgi:probable F420-dependent oxidoreductase